MSRIPDGTVKNAEEILNVLGIDLTEDGDIEICWEDVLKTGTIKVNVEGIEKGICPTVDSKWLLYTNIYINMHKYIYMLANHRGFASRPGDPGSIPG